LARTSVVINGNVGQMRLMIYDWGEIPRPQRSTLMSEYLHNETGLLRILGRRTYVATCKMVKGCTM